MTETREHRSIGERREQLVDAALVVLREGGLRAVTTRAVTSEAGLPHGAFHYCFPTKTGLFRAVLERQLRATMASAFTSETAPLPPRQRIAAAFTAHLGRVRSDPDTALALLELVALSRRDTDLREVAAWEQHAYIEAVRDHVNAWTAEAGLRWSAPTEDVARLLIATADGIATTWLSDRDDAGSERAVQLAASTIATLAQEARA